jgi:hypothetical protein
MDKLVLVRVTGVRGWLGGTTIRIIAMAIVMKRREGENKR